jgi:hypothetical protein
MRSVGGADASELNEALEDHLFAPLNLNGAVRTEEVTVQFENNSQADTALRNLKPGDGSAVFTAGAFDIQTTDTGTDTQAIETASIGEYAAGLPAGIGMEVQKETDPTGIAEWGFGGDDFTDGFYWRLNSDGSYEFVREKGGVETPIPRSLWKPSVDRQTVEDDDGNDTGVVSGRDPLDGSGESEADIATPVLGLFGVDFVLYGGGGFAPWFVDLTATGNLEKIYPFVFHPTDENILEQFNQPIFGRLDNDGTATADSLLITERQFSQFGTNSAPERGTQHCFDLEKTVSSPTCLLAARRAEAGGGTRLDIIDTTLSANTNAHVWYLVDPDVTANGGDPNWSRPTRDFAGNQAPASETKVEVNEDLEVDPTTGIALDGDIVQGTSGGGPPGSRIAPETTSFRSSPFIRDRPVAVMIEPFAAGSDVTSQEGIVNINEGF